MKKELKSKSKRKWILGGIAAFSSIALLTTGFSVWVVGSQKKEDTGDVNVTVDTSKNDSVKFTMDISTDNSIELKESSAIDIGFVTNSESVSNPLQISATFTLEFGSSHQIANYKEIQFSIEEPGAGEDGYASVKVSEDYNLFKNTELSKTESENKVKVRETGNFTYLDAPEKVTIITDGDKFATTSDDSSSTKKYTCTTTLEFKWGSFFNNQSPCTFYNGKFSDTQDQTVENAEKINKELNAMHTQLNGKKIHLKATLVENTSTGEQK